MITYVAFMVGLYQLGNQSNAAHVLGEHQLDMY